MKIEVADLLNRRLAVVRGESIYPPGALIGFRAIEPGGSEVTVISRGDALDVYSGKNEITSFSITTRTALRIGWFLLWRWWVRGTWCGLKLRLWRWTIAVKINDRLRRRAPAR